MWIRSVRHWGAWGCLIEPASDNGRGLSRRRSASCLLWTWALIRTQSRRMRPRASRPDTLQSVTVLEALDGLAAQHGEAGVPFKELEAATRSRLSFRALTDALNALVGTGAVRRVTERPARLAITNAGRKLLNEYRS